MELRITENVLDAHHGQVDVVLLAKRADTGEVVGKLHYALFQKKAHISWIEVPEEHRRQGVGRTLADRLYSEYGRRGVVWGMTTPAGTKLKAALGRRSAKQAPAVADLGMALSGKAWLLLLGGGVAVGALLLLRSGGGGVALGKIQAALAEGRQLWQQWQALPQAEKDKKILAMVNDGIGDHRSQLLDYKNLWCGAFAAWIMRQAVHPVIRLTSFASTLRLAALAKYDATFMPQQSVLQADGKRIPLREYHKAHGGERQWQTPAQAGSWSWPPQPGDVALVGSAGKNPAVPAHVTVVDSFDQKTQTVQAINGNGGGVDPSGKKAYGVVLTQFKPADVKLLLRLAPADFDQSLKYA